LNELDSPLRFGHWSLVFARATADDGLGDVVERVRVVLNRAGALVAGGARMKQIGRLNPTTPCGKCDRQGNGCNSKTVTLTGSNAHSNSFGRRMGGGL
jgi:hypothetical protein